MNSTQDSDILTQPDEMDVDIDTTVDQLSGPAMETLDPSGSPTNEPFGHPSLPYASQHQLETSIPKVEEEVRSHPMPPGEGPKIQEIHLLQERVSELEAIQQEKERSENELVSQLSQQIQTLKEDINRKESEARRDQNSSNAKINEYIRKTQKLNQIIIKLGHQWKEPPDTEIESATVAIRSAITRIIRTHYTAREMRIRKSTSRHGRSSSFYDKIKHSSGETARRLLVAELFSLLESHIFSKRFFGLESLDKAMEHTLGKFEKLISSNRKVTKQEAEEWRVRTVDCAARLDPDLTQRATDLTNSITDFLFPILLSGPRGDTDEAWRDISSDIETLCVDCLKLTMRFRSTQTQYSFRILDPGQPLSNFPEDLYEIQEWEGQQPNVTHLDMTSVFRMLFGALIKTKQATGIEGEKEIVLAKAHVIVQDDRLHLRARR